ncbi:MAG: FAD:protein FMN transferase [Patescibacteria group bacterium]
MTRSVEFEAIGTHWKIDIDEDIPDAQRDAAVAEVMGRIGIFDRDYSRFRPDSLVTEMSHRAGTYDLPDDADPMLRLYQTAYQLTGGLVTPLIGQVLVEAGYDAEYSLIPKELHHPPSWEEAIEFQPPKTLVVKRPALLDFGAFGKGYLVDIVGEILWKNGLRSFCVDAGGDLFHRSADNEPLRVGLEHPQDFSKVIGIATVANRSLCGSAGNRRAWGEFHHIINPQTLSSPRDILAVWTVAKTTMLADAMATCLYFTSPDKLSKYFTFDYLIMYPDSSIKTSKGFPAEMFFA